MNYAIELSRQAVRALSQELPVAVALACFEFIRGPLAENPYRVGKALGEPLAPAFSARRGEFRIIYEIYVDRVVVAVISIRHRRDAYRS